MEEIVNKVLQNERQYRKIISYCAEIASSIFTASSDKLFKINVEQNILNSYQKEIVEIKEQIMTMNLVSNEAIEALTNQEIYNGIIRPINIKLLGREAK